MDHTYATVYVLRMVTSIVDLDQPGTEALQAAGHARLSRQMGKLNE